MFLRFLSGKMHRLISVRHFLRLAQGGRFRHRERWGAASCRL